MITTLKSFELSAMITLETRCHTLLVQAQCYALQRADDVLSHDQKRASDWTRQDPVAEQLVVRDFTRPSFSGGLKGVACETILRGLMEKQDLDTDVDTDTDTDTDTVDSTSYI